MKGLRTVLAPNASPMTLDGTRTFIVGREQVAVIDPGPELPAHLDNLVRALDGAREVAILLTHRHADHAAAGPALARRVSGSARVTYGPAVPSEGDACPTDAGDLRVIATPGHAPEHVSLHWRAEAAIFCGDLMMGGLDTALVAAPEGNLTEYLESLDRLARLSPRVIYPTHGPEFTSPAWALARYRSHRAARLEEVLAAVDSGGRRLAEIAAQVYGGQLDPDLKPWVEATTLAYLEHLLANGLVEPGEWHDD